MTVPTVLLGDLVMGESVRWHDGRLWFCDWVAGEIIVLDAAGKPEVVARMQGLPFCLDWLADGRMLVTSADGRLLRREPDGSLVTHAELGGSFPWNEVVVDGRGNIFVDNIGYDFPGGAPAPGFVTVVTPYEEVRPVAGGLEFPNGMAVVGETLIVAESHAGRLTAFDIEPDGSLVDQRVWAAVEGSAPDGICADAEGAIWYADVPNRECVRVREGGEVVQRVALDRGGFSCALSDTATLYAVTADFSDPAAMFSGRTGQLVSVGVDVPGVAR
jgi:sugar lactone lactonase YvrE